jgi:pyruvate dehydrogenase E1 component alpha subunit
MTPDRDQAIAMLRAMIRIRRLEERCAEDYAAGKIRGFLHLYIGEEAVAAGVIPALGPSDAVIATYREHGHALLRGVSADAIMAEMYGKSSGCARGRGGSMHLFSREHRFFGGHAIVGGGLAVSVGIALADKLRATRAVTCVFFGDGAAAEGEFSESLNLASLWNLPVLFVCENNRYAMGTSLEREHAEPALHKKAAVHRIGSELVDGMDVTAVSEAATQAVERIRETGSPWFLECMTYRFRAHSMFDPELYRDKAEVEVWRKRDPIATFIARMAGVVTEKDIEALEGEAAAEVAKACAFAEASPLEPIADLLRDVRAES